MKLRLVNEMAGDHPMHHPFHVHGAGRFLVLSRDGIVEPNLVWKDTVLIPTGQTVDILLDVTNPGVGWLTATSPSTTRAGRGLTPASYCAYRSGCWAKAAAQVSEQK